MSDFFTPSQEMNAIHTQLQANYWADEDRLLNQLIEEAHLTEQDRTAISVRAAKLVRSVRSSTEPALMETFLAEYGLSTKEGVALMCLAEALLRVPDAETIDDLIQDKIAPHDWSKHIGGSSSILVNASTWGLVLTGQVLDPNDNGLIGTMRGLVRKLGEPVIRVAVGRAMREMGTQFVLGRSINEAIQRGNTMMKRGYTHSFDMLGEAAVNEADALRYVGSYSQAIASITPHCTKQDIRDNPGISVKLSALHPRYEVSNRDEVLDVLSTRTLKLAQAAKAGNMGFNIDAEEADRLELSLQVIARVLSDDSLAGWDGFGVVVQAYGKRAAKTIDWLYALAEKLDRKIMVRLVKGAYWDSEIKKSQVQGLAGYPVFTRKVNTDISYMACAQKLISMKDRIYPQFATHNAHSVAAIIHMAGDDTRCFEFQRLHGMGDTLYSVIEKENQTRCRIYAPVGEHRDLLAYLVRRLLENGANSSFVHQIVDPNVAPETIGQDPIDQAKINSSAFNVDLPTPQELFGSQRINSRGWDIRDFSTLSELHTAAQPFESPYQWQAAPKTTATGGSAPHKIINPALPDDLVGEVTEATPEQAIEAISIGVKAQPQWANTPLETRKAVLLKIADLIEDNAPELFTILRREAGKILLDQVGEVREAVDFLRYYAKEARHSEKDTTARGVFICISPWNFPLAIYIGQIAAALVTGNAVIAKPAEQTPLIAARLVELMYEAGVPQDILQLIPGDGPNVGAALIADPRIAGVCFTGSTEVAQLINNTLAKVGNDAVLIAETGGINAMIVDSTALPEQAVRDIIASSFQSAGQRCSALRMLYVQKDVADRLIDMLTGAMDSICLDDPAHIRTDVGPVIDLEAKQLIIDHCQKLDNQGKLIKKLDIPKELKGNYVAPALYRVSGIEEMEREVFGPILHVATFDADNIQDVARAINGRGYGLTFGVHSRIDGRVQEIIDAVDVGNYYVNRNQIGAVVGSQPFGGHGYSGTGPKAGGPLYLRRFRQSTACPKSLEYGASTASKNEIVSCATIDKAASKLDNTWLLAREDRPAKVRALLKGAATDAMSASAALDMGPMDLPGPTGESNRYLMTARGTILCLGETAEIALTQAVQALTTGNKVVVVAPNAVKACAPLVKGGMPIVAFDGQIEANTLTSMKSLSAVAFYGDEAQLMTYKEALAKRSGPILLVISELINPGSYCHEKTVSTDTTAAGGNAQLLAEIS